jgi:hypothetical protein
MKEVSIPNIRWMMYLKNGNIIVENHDHGRTWKKVYKDNYGNIEALCFQLIPDNTKFFITVSPTDEYWTFEDFETAFGGSTKHLARSICSKQYVKFNENGIGTAYWNVITIDSNKKVHKSIMTSEEIGYHSL